MFKAFMIYLLQGCAFCLHIEPRKPTKLEYLLQIYEHNHNSEINQHQIFTIQLWMLPQNSDFPIINIQTPRNIRCGILAVCINSEREGSNDTYFQWSPVSDCSSPPKALTCIQMHSQHLLLVCTAQSHIVKSCYSQHFLFVKSSPCKIFDLRIFSQVETE